MEGIAKRIFELRKSLNINQEDFAQKIDLDRSHISKLEKGTISPKNRHISLICRAFDVNEAWLRTGEGDMFTKPPKSPTPSTNEEETLLNNFRRLLPETRTAILKIVQDMQKDPENTK